MKMSELHKRLLGLAVAAILLLLLVRSAPAARPTRQDCRTSRQEDG